MFYTSLNLAIMYNCGRMASAYNRKGLYSYGRLKPTKMQSDRASSAGKHRLMHHSSVSK